MNSSKFQQIIYRWKKDKSCNLKWLSVEKFVLQHSWLVHIPRGYVLLSGVAFCTVWCKMTPIISVPQAHMDVAVLLRKNVYRPLEEVAVHKQTQTHKLNGYRDQLEETMDKVEHDLQVVSNCDVIFVKPGQVSLNVLQTVRYVTWSCLVCFYLCIPIKQCRSKSYVSSTIVSYRMYFYQVTALSYQVVYINLALRSTTVVLMHQWKLY